MDTVFIPNENDFRKWITAAVKECLENTSPKSTESAHPQQEMLMTRKEIAGIFRISLVTLHDWMKRGLPFHKQRGRVYFLRSEVLAYVKQKQKQIDGIGIGDQLTGNNIVDFPKPGDLTLSE